MVFLDRLRQAKFNPNLKSSWSISVMQIISIFTIITVIRTGAAHSRANREGLSICCDVCCIPPEIMFSKNLVHIAYCGCGGIVAACGCSGGC